MQEKITQLSGAIVDDVVAFGAENVCVPSDSRSSSSDASSQDDFLASVTSIEAKISYLAKRIISDVVCGKSPRDKGIRK